MPSRPVGRLLVCGVCALIAMASTRAIAQTTKLPAKKSASTPPPLTVQPTSGTAQLKTASDPPATSNGATVQPKQRPAAEPLRIPEPSPDVLQILRDWEAKTAKIQRVEGEFRKLTYDLTFTVASVAVGNFCYEAPDKGAYQLKGDKPKEKTILKPVNGKEVEFTVQPDQPERWVCDGKQVFKFDDPQKTYSRYLIPAEQQGVNIINGPLPFLLGMKADLAKKRWEFKLLKRTEAEIWLSARPLQRQDAELYQRSTIILDTQSFLPKAVQMLDPAETRETVHMFRGVKINRNRANWLGEDPLKISLKGYKEAQNPEAPPNSQTGSPGSKTSPRTASGVDGVTPSKSTTTKPGSKTATK